MKKLLLLLILGFSLSFISYAQDDNKAKTKKTATVPQRVHNTVSKHKRYNGHVTKHKHGNSEYKHKHTDTKSEVKHD